MFLRFLRAIYIPNISALHGSKEYLNPFSQLGLQIC